ncbi:hypothetical protein HG445_001630 [Candidatus Saccharibacteria bacterium]|nr:hypothetical protein [Candidatus Saccharibacteria bacterium]
MEKKDLEVLPGFKEGRFAKWLRRVIYPITARTPFRVFLSLLVASALMWWGFCVASAGTSTGNFPAIMAGALMMLGAAVGVFFQIASISAVTRREDAEMAALVVATVCSQIPIPDPSSTDEVDTKEG